jgi:phosphoadenosine phosphosulfate reductase
MNKEMIEKKIADTEKFIREVFKKYPPESLAVSWTGGKDSTVMLWMIREVCLQDKRPIPTCFCINEGDMFDEVHEFLAKYIAEWNLKLDIIHNDDVSRAAGGKLGAMVKVADLDERNRAEVARLGYEEDEFAYEPESYVGNHLMKTATLNRYIEAKKIRAFFAGIRWDEQQARANETYISPRAATAVSPAHDRLHPILHFTERDIWDATRLKDIPYCKLYAEGFRSLGARVTTSKTTHVAAWEQDLENTTERGGRRQDKENLMAKLRSLGYM